MVQRLFLCISQHLFDHSLGVYDIIRIYGGSLREQVAGLLYDASHTAFSHSAGDYMFGMAGIKSYQDDIHCQSLIALGLDSVLKKHGFSVEAVELHHNTLPLLKQKYPYLCADRIEYILHTGIVFNKVQKKK